MKSLKAESLDSHTIGKWSFILCWIPLFIFGLTNYSGSWVNYSVFSASFFVVLASGFYRQVSYGYLFLVTMLWLGFWLKVTVHLIIDYPFGEPVGFFAGTPGEWDEVLIVASIGGLGVLGARLLYGLSGGPSSMTVRDSNFVTPAWYPGIRKWVWAGLMLACIGIAIANMTWGIQQSGLVPTTILIWPLNAVTYWLLANGFALTVATLLWWDINLGRNVSMGLYLVLVEAFASSVSILSRGIYIFHVIPQLLATYYNRERVFRWKRTNFILLFAAFILAFAISLPLVNSLRAHYYSGGTTEWGLGGTTEWGLEGAIKGVPALAKFIVDRWIGIEGTMAVTAFPDKSGDLLVQGLMERSEIGKSTIYQEICQAHYRFLDMSKYRFASLPGATAFLYFSGNIWIVFLGMIALTLVVLVSEGLIFRLTCNPLLCALWGVNAAKAMTNMGVAPRGLLVYFLEMILGIAVIIFIQSRYCASAMNWLDTFVKNVKKKWTPVFGQLP